MCSGDLLAVLYAPLDRVQGAFEAGEVVEDACLYMYDVYMFVCVCVCVSVCMCVYLHVLESVQQHEGVDVLDDEVHGVLRQHLRVTDKLV
jgi:hypothetical protein